MVTVIKESGKIIYLKAKERQSIVTLRHMKELFMKERGTATGHSFKTAVSLLESSKMTSLRERLYSFPITGRHTMVNGDKT